jgi:hypothetical protein
MHESTCLERARQCPHCDQPNLNDGLQLAARRAGPGTELSTIFADLGIVGCQGCHALALQMDAWGPAGCRANMERIIDEIFGRAKSGNWLARIAAGIAPGLMRQRIRNYVEQALQRAEQKG